MVPATHNVIGAPLRLRASVVPCRPKAWPATGTGTAVNCQRARLSSGILTCKNPNAPPNAAQH
eukprot:12320125-Alexandrium_andersonii.AAC.1